MKSKNKKLAPNPQKKTYSMVVKMWKAGKNVKEIMKATTRSRVVVYHHLRKAERNGEIPLRKRSAKDVLAIIGELNRGTSQAEVGRKFNVTRSYINQIAIDARSKGLLGKTNANKTTKEKAVAAA